jgi:hypothetical protein
MVRRVRPKSRLQPDPPVRPSFLASVTGGAPVNWVLLERFNWCATKFTLSTWRSTQSAWLCSECGSSGNGLRTMAPVVSAMPRRIFGPMQTLMRCQLALLRSATNSYAAWRR